MALEQGALHTNGWDWGPALPSPGLAGQGLEPRAPGEGAGGPAQVLIPQCHGSVVVPGFMSPWTRVLLRVVATHRKGKWPGPWPSWADAVFPSRNCSDLFWAQPPSPAAICLHVAEVLTGVRWMLSNLMDFDLLRYSPDMKCQRPHVGNGGLPVSPGVQHWDDLSVTTGLLRTDHVPVGHSHLGAFPWENLPGNLSIKASLPKAWPKCWP